MSSKKILIVDDCETERHIIGKILTKHGYEVCYAESGEMGVIKAKQDKPDLVLMDVVMPGLNGFQATRAIGKDADTAQIPVIICTTKDQETDKIWGMRQGAKEYLVKPVNEVELLEKIVSLI